MLRTVCVLEQMTVTGVRGPEQWNGEAVRELSWATYSLEIKRIDSLEPIKVITCVNILTGSCDDDCANKL